MVSQILKYLFHSVLFYSPAFKIPTWSASKKSDIEYKQNGHFKAFWEVEGLEIQSHSQEKGWEVLLWLMGQESTQESCEINLQYVCVFYHSSPEAGSVDGEGKCSRVLIKHCVTSNQQGSQINQR